MRREERSIRVIYPLVGFGGEQSPSFLMGFSPPPSSSSLSQKFLAGEAPSSIWRDKTFISTSAAEAERGWARYFSSSSSF